MTTILLVTHGAMGPGLLDSAAMICGELPNTSAVRFDVGQSPEDLKDAIEERLGTADGDELLFLSDLPGGTPARVTAEYAARGRGEAVTGVNLPMLIEVVMAAETSDARSLAELAVSRGLEGVIDVGQQIRAALANENGSTTT